MSVAKRLRYAPKKFAVGEFAIALKAIVGQLARHGASPRFTVYRSLGDGSRETISADASSPELQRIVDLAIEETRVRVFTGSGLVDTWFDISGYEDELEVRLESPSPEQFYAASKVIASELGLSSLPDGANEDLDVEDRLLRVERELRQLALAGLERPVRCFLSTRFGPRSEPYVLRVQRFLTLLGIEVVTGQGYEPLKVSDKVRSRLSGDIDFVVLIVGSDGESTWTRDEIAFATARDLPVVPLVERGSTFEPGIFGDLEFLPFEPGHIGDALVGLLEAVRYVEGRSRRPSSDEVPELPAV